MNSTAITDEKEEITEVKLECHLEVKTEDSCGKTLTFEFSYPDVDPVEISQEFVSIRIIQNRYRYIIGINLILMQGVTFVECLLIICLFRLKLVTSKNITEKLSFIKSMT